MPIEAQLRTKHVLAANLVVLPCEDIASYDELRRALVAEYDPASPSEAFLVDQLAQNWWRLNRSRRYETGMLSNIEPGSTGPGPSPKDLDHHRRYEAAIERAYYRAYDRIERVKSRRRRELPSDPKPAAEPQESIGAIAAVVAAASTQIQQSTPVNPIGFVSYFAPSADPKVEPATTAAGPPQEPRKCA